MNRTTEAALQKFIRRWTRANSGCTKITLIQVSTGGHGGTLREIEIKTELGYDDALIDETLAEFLSTAQEDANNHRGITSYVLRAVKGVTAGERSTLFRLRSEESDMDEALGDTEPATKDGHLAQLMRHNETLMRMNVQMVEVMSNQSTAIIARLSDTNKHYEDKHFENIMRAEELANEKDEREGARLMLKAQEKRKDELLGVIKPLIPIVLSKLKGVPKDAKPELWKEAIKQVLSEITPDKMNELATLLGPQSLALAEIWIEANKDKLENERADEPVKTH